MQELKASPNQVKRPMRRHAPSQKSKRKKGYDVFTVMAFAFFMAGLVTVAFVWMFKSQKASVVADTQIVRSSAQLNLADAVAQADVGQRSDLLARLEADEIYRKIILSDGMWQSDMLQFWMMFVHEQGKVSVVFVNKSLPDLRMYFSGRAEWIPAEGGLVFKPDVPMIAPQSLPFVDDGKSRKEIKELTYQPLTKEPIHFDVSFEGADMIWSVPWQSFKGVPSNPDTGFAGVPSHPIFRYISSQSLRWMPLEGE